MKMMITQMMMMKSMKTEHHLSKELFFKAAVDAKKTVAMTRRKWVCTGSTRFPN